MNMAGEPQLAIGMWIAMMAAMMLPGAVGAVIRVPGYRARIVFVAAYLAVWSAFGVAAAALQFMLESRELLTSDMALRGATGANLSLLVIGAYQLTPVKRACLRLCRSEVVPLRYAFACLGASWLLMGILFVVGVMSVIWVATIALWIAAEKALGSGGRLAAAAGVGLIVWGSVRQLL
jgi:predicted metal-binding membrane protein